MSNRGRKLPKPPKKIKKAEKNRPRISIATIVLGLATLLGGIAAAVTFLPRVTPTISDPVDLDNAFSSTVTITNNGYIPLNAVAVRMGMGEMCTKGAPCVAPDFPNPMREYRSTFQRSQWVSHDMAVDDRFTIALDDITRAADPDGLVYADIAVIVDYEIPIIHWKREKTFPLYSRKATNGKLYWQWK